MRKAKNYAEVVLWKELSNKEILGFRFGRQKVIGHYMADFCCERAGIVVEVDGSSHIGREEYDKERDDYMHAMGFTILRFSDFDILHNIDYVLREIEKACAPRQHAKRHPIQ